MATRTTPTTLAGTFSFYVPSGNVDLIEACSDLADGITVTGAEGPRRIRELRSATGWDAPVLFDRAGYASAGRVDHGRWFDDQAAAGADRLLTVGSWVQWDPTAETLDRAIEIEADRIDGHPDATAVLAIDYRWLTAAPLVLVRAIKEMARPVALVLAHRGDPLSANGAVHGLVEVTRSCADVTILRTDQGGIGALVYGGAHAALGLDGRYRHFVPRVCCTFG